MWVSKKKWRATSKKIASLENTIQSQQKDINFIKEAFMELGLDLNQIRDPSSRKQF